MDPPPDPMTAEEADFEAGAAAAFDPQKHKRTALTGLNSWWNHLLCDRCGHTFRRGERVHVTREPRAAHHAELPGVCHDPAKKAPSAPVLAADVAEFAEGVEAVWGSGDTPVRTLGADDWRVARPPAPMQRTRCLVCAHTLRAGERVVVCPCNPGRPECAATIHRDPAAGLTCWETWRPAGTVTSCPITMARRTGA
ncbi:hypothetical protein [Paractinoplanes globisporus]|uniref:Uncharacterized protein n=1 Tax=Paractinoplanes globisporus TaxID=113565 RepID=A0ABW6WF10_9ACTN|nr:hypothetical protein [Actinoplanes globisporus]